MVKKHFYHHIVSTESLVVSMSELDLSEQERMHLHEIMESSLHHTILDAILSELSESDKKLFLKNLHDDDHDAVWKFLKERIDKIEDKIVRVSEQLKEGLHDDMRRVKNDKKTK